MALKFLVASTLGAASLVDVATAENSTTTTVTTTTDGLTDIALDVQGQSGKFSLYATAVGANDPNKITVTMDSLYEVDSDGNIVGAGGNKKHSIQTFAAQDFTVLEPVRENLGIVNTQKTTFSSTVSGDIGEIGVDTIIVLGHGVVGPASESWEVWPGDLKWNIRFPSWTWCGDKTKPNEVECKQGNSNEIGAFLDLDIEVKGSLSQTSKATGGKEEYSLGGGVDLLLTKKVTIDGNETEMPGDYPKVEMKGGKQVFKFRFPKFSDNATYDPILTMSSSESIPAPPTTTTGILFSDDCRLLYPGLWSLIAVGLANLLAQ